ncbi:MAG: hypothetical protein KC609_02225 [Myxococcales bacterium]|nr:hypothetical protein [Myxococcales bacterium]
MSPTDSKRPKSSARRHPTKPWHDELPDVVHVIDTLPRCKPVERQPLPTPKGKTSIRALIQQRLDADFALYNSNNDAHFIGLIQPAGSTPTRSGWRLQRKRPIDRAVIEAALYDAIAKRRIFVALDGVAQTNLDADLRVKSQSVLEFVVLFPIVAG